jgi:non-homologous end joining protein Ku
MAAVAKGVALSFGLVTASVSVHNAIEKVKSGNVLVCANGHEPRQIRMPRVCDEIVTVDGKDQPHGEVEYKDIKKAVPVAGGLVVLNDADLANVRSDGEAFKKRAPLTAHPVEGPEMATTSGGKLYFLTPDPGHEASYALIKALVEAHPELALMTQWTPRSVASEFRVLVFKDVVVLQERVRQGAIKDAPTVTVDAPPEAMLALIEQVLLIPGFITDYDPATYADTSADKLAAIIATKTVVPVAASATPGLVAPTAAVDALAALTAMLAATSTASPAVAPKRSRKKVTA